MQSTFQGINHSTFHVAVIMDGNGRWATSRGLSRSEGHKEGSKAVRRVAETAPTLDITTLTLYAFSSDNWKRPTNEVNHLMALFYEFLYAEKERCIANGIRLSVIGRRDRLSLPLRAAIKMAETATSFGQTMHLRIAIDYSARDSILRTASRLETRQEISRELFARLLAETNHSGAVDPDVDLLIRTGGERRLSDFMLWESAYAELVFSEKMWPDFDEDDLAAAVREFHQRDRRFGELSVLV
ncbi:MAG: di-trans,poly-cis-decaprenylcistransferase [Candidatus Omnitrophota bacterium]|jgi:undecaprenyl diphosphate synthase|nr:MAG: di-trans,poly-cis-decaprenylcistransferase [Candidatus Omnitrophota bacterium]